MKSYPVRFSLPRCPIFVGLLLFVLSGCSSTPPQPALDTQNLGSDGKTGDSAMGAMTEAPTPTTKPSAKKTEANSGVLAVPRWAISDGPLYYELSPQERTRPIIVGDILYFTNSTGKVTALHRTEGYVLWSMTIPSHATVDGAFSYARAKLYVGDNQGNLYALNSRDGSVAWTFKGQSEWLSPPVVAHERVLAGTSSDELYALDEETGKEIWHFSRRGDEKMTIRGTSTPAVFGTEVFYGFSDGSLVALTIGKGKLLWTQRLRSHDRFYDIDMRPEVDQNRVIAATFDGNLYSLDRLTGETKWVFRVGSYGGFLVENDRLYFSGLNGSFYCLDKNNGEVIWKTPFQGGVGSTPVRAGKYLIITTSSDPVYVLDSETGKVVATKGLGSGSLAAAEAQPDGWFYVMSNFGNLYAFELLTGMPIMKGPKTLAAPSALRRVIVAD